MVRRIERLRTLLFSVAVGGSLMFGARTALAAPSAGTCPEFAIGRCTNQPNCQMKCDPPFAGTGLTGICENGCCSAWSRPGRTGTDRGGAWNGVDAIEMPPLTPEEWKKGLAG